MPSDSNSALDFGLAKSAYSSFRPEYSPELFERIIKEVPEEHRQRAVDLGAGTGLSTLPIGESFAEVIAVEPDARMAAEIPRSEGLSVQVCKAEEAAIDDDSVDLVTVGTAFYWMDGPRVLGNSVRWLRKGGVLAVYRYSLPRLPRPVQKLLDSEFEQHWDEFRDRRLLDEEYSWRCVEGEADLRNSRIMLISNIIPMEVAAFVGFFSSTSYCSAYLRTLEDPRGYVEELERSFRSAHPRGEIPVDFAVELILSRVE